MFEGNEFRSAVDEQREERGSFVAPAAQLGALTLSVAGLPALVCAATDADPHAADPHHGDGHGAETHADGAHGGAHGGHHAGIESLVWPTINFAIYLALMSYLYKRFAGPALKARAVTFDEQFRRAERALEDAERELRGAQNRADQIEEEQAAIEARFGAEAQSLSRDIADAARRSIAQIEADVQRRIDSEKARAFEQLRHEAVARAARLAREKLRSGLSADDDYRLRHETLRGLI